ncbi:hypothetical protein H6G54_13760 [Anabaena cylindrica FACHB-243]|uniref:Uncharacterized protein n=1 Tax=Anabaena cylindrica (strain ATCC 27899 / PCC 7122) TaxID=272123 RepID=K9ZLD1_ANACC|nr:MULTISPECIES: hypothetical protein [Anabaena]AFZ59594.1 hypothetical protein Anacy_4229 [Anabaena cylindrica PCC 7122]MBD2418742.1 hypothetical protein [Anabaena cylindrica FACHB-243]MBY5281631.1 hypothetical protein [Anabaena sp. CCAP 1446/1C]MBY5309157.1 hypothetical protein [Anabaena sp. CCAP 1446/1C]MCM2406306.1 hypothetical protein [Anabaena sp. CCAP 1446/1C]
MSYSRSSTQGSLLPKSEKLETKTTWTKRNSSHLRLIHSEAPKSSALIPSEIQKLVEELVEKIEGVERVIAIATSFPDIHWIDFKIRSKPDTELSDEIWDKIQDMVIDCEWKLIDDSAEEWYFRPQIVDRFYLLKDEVIADSDKKQHTVVSKPKMWSSNSPKFIEL